MAKKRLYEVAKEYNISSEAIVKLVRELGFDVKSHMSTADDDMLTAISSKFSEEKETVKQEISRKKKMFSRWKSPVVVEEKAPEVFEFEEPAGTEKIVSKAKIIERTARQAAELRKKKKERRKKKRHEDIKTAEVKAAFRKTMAKLDLGKRMKKYKRKEKPDGTIVEEETNVIQVTEFMSLAELAATIGVKPADLIAKCMELGMMVTINQRLDIDTIATLSLEYGLEVEEVKEIGVEEEEETTMMRIFSRALRSSRSWVMSITARHRCWITFANRISPPVKQD